jgi:alanine dehydrogenase
MAVQAGAAHLEKSKGGMGILLGGVPGVPAAHVVILKGVEIGDGTVVGAGSVVTKSLPPRVLAVGSPAKVLREFDGGERA